MSDPIDYSHLSASWLYWAPRAGLKNAQVASASPDRDIWFRSDDYSVHLRYDDDWWAIDTIDDRGQLRNDIAKFTAYDLVEKFLIWQWSSAARNARRLPRIGPELYSLGHNSDVQFIKIKEGIYELRIGGQRAILMEPSATIFSHLMLKSTNDIEELIRRDL